MDFWIMERNYFSWWRRQGYESRSPVSSIFNIGSTPYPLRDDVLIWTTPNWDRPKIYFRRLSPQTLYNANPVMPDRPVHVSQGWRLVGPRSEVRRQEYHHCTPQSILILLRHLPAPFQNQHFLIRPTFSLPFCSHPLLFVIYLVASWTS